jgi:hypothetical protein
LHIESFKREKRLAADNGNGCLTLAVEKESGVSEVVYGAVRCGHRKQNGNEFWREVTVVFFFC